ncbi:DUF1707 SHOCT-like domain-containing protein [Streptomyces canus]|uniref:DUF1707 SHOCT-like domain-containing protein n=1 Tax=Streptomyces canus TaxID=58343 RepID=UPI00225B5FF2|nr:DUF1707 domain-containing protein [Streptomyces canus]MCX4852223.1 DUF1707 domain-containing protein [Streptomyces canus]
MDKQQSSADATGPVAAEDMRASNADRDQVLEIIRDAAAEGRLTPEELEQRVQSALAARTLRDLATLTRDLPEQPKRTKSPIPAKDLVKIVKRIGSVEWVGPWVVPRRMEIKLTVGNAKIDFSDAVVTDDVLSIDVDLGIGGDLLLITRPGIVVVANEVIVRMGDLKVRPPQQDQNHPVDLRIEVTGQLRGGDFVVRYPRGLR